VVAGIFIGLMSVSLILGSTILRSSVRNAAVAIVDAGVAADFGDEMSRASVAITDLARDFVAEGEVGGLERFQGELESKRREKVLGRALGLPSEEREALSRAKAKSDLIVGLEARAMRLAAEARGLTAAELPPAIRGVELPDAERRLPAADKLARARSLLFGPEYWQAARDMRKEALAFGDLSVAHTAKTIHELETGADHNFVLALLLTGLALAGILIVAVANYRLVTVPVRHYVDAIQTDKPDDAGYPELLPEGGYELAALAEAINRRRDQRIQAERALRDSELKLRTNLLMMPLGSMEVDVAGNIRSWNPAAELMFGYLEKEVAGRDFVELIVPEGLRDEVRELIGRIAQGEVIDRHILECVTKDGRAIVCEWYDTPLYDSSGAWIGWVSLVKDITEQKAEADRILYLSRHDPLTGLLNRRSMQEKLEEEHRRSMRTESAYSCIMLDIDRFKNFNDSYGHECGDVVLKGVADALRQSVRATDSVSRWGGEEFLILMPDTGNPGGLELAEKIRARIQSESIAYGDLSFSVTLTAGVASCRSEDESEEACVRRADEALLAGKASGRNRVVPSP